MTAFPTEPPDPRLYTILAEAGFGADLFNPHQHRSCVLVERYALELAVDLAARLELVPLLAAPCTVEEIAAARGFAPAFEPALRWLLARLTTAGILLRDGTRHRLPAPLPAPPLAALRTEILAVDPAYAPALALLDEAAALYPRVARGEVDGERALFLRATLWVGYFNNANPYYALNNRVSAHAAAVRLPAAGARILEVGTGLGSATETLLGELDAAGRLGSVAAYDASEPVVFFRRRAARTLAAAWPRVPLTGTGLDLNAPWAEQGVAPASLDLVWGVNVFHLAQRLDVALREARAALTPGGWLVCGEGLRPGPMTPVGAELPFQLLRSFTDVEVDPVTRPTPGFLTAEHWQAAFARAGFIDVTLVPDALRLRALYPGFLAAAICGRRP
jgi:SAM-dependent methyltransferase